MFLSQFANSYQPSDEAYQIITTSIHSLSVFAFSFVLLRAASPLLVILFKYLKLLTPASSIIMYSANGHWSEYVSSIVPGVNSPWLVGQKMVSLPCNQRRSHHNNNKDTTFIELLLSPAREEHQYKALASQDIPKVVQNILS